MQLIQSSKMGWSRLLVAMAALVLLSCQSAYYGAMEKFGYQKRDILVSRVETARDAQTDAKEQFASALERFRSVVAVEAGELEERYDKLQAEYDKSKIKAEQVHERIAAVEDVAEALFEEWEDELEEYQNQSLRRNSARQLEQTRERYRLLVRTMKAAEAKMAPVLEAFQDQVLFLKHNLNARAIASIRTEAAQVQSEVEALIRSMERSITEADKFIRDMAKP